MSGRAALTLALTTTLAALPARADEIIYDDTLAPGWSDYSWDAAVDLESTSPVHGGTHAIQVETDPWGALALHGDQALDDSGVLRFWIAGDAPDLVITLVDELAGETSAGIVPLELASVTPGTWTEILVELAPHGAHDWTRIDWQDDSGLGSEFSIDDIELLDEAPAPTEYSGAMPVAPDRVLVLGGGETDGFRVLSGGEEVAIAAVETATDPHRVYLTLADSLAPGSLVIETPDGSFSRIVAAATAAVGGDVIHDISPWIYGVAMPPDSGYVSRHGMTVARWGGNNTSLYNPLGHYANTAADWYFENFVLGSADEWLGEMAQGGARTFLSVPALDWVARDGESYSYSVELYGPQDDVDPFLPDAGNGVLEDGTPITWNDPADAATPWDTDDVRTWLAGLSTQPDVAAVGNELDICAQTHRDVHPEPMGYDELLQRVTDTAAVIRDELPGTAIAGPSSCCWWYYWNDDAGEKPLHGGQDLLPWFLDQLAEADAAAGQRSLDILDIHYYPESEVFNDGTDPDTAARRLRATRSLWDPTYTDEGWIGDDTDATVHQPDPNQVQLIPRFRALIDEHYPGTELAIGEWNFGADAHLSGGLATADALGIFGRQQLHMATFWSFPAEGTPAAAAFQLYRDPDHPFGDRSLRTAVDDPDQLGLHAALDDSGGLTLVAINKDPDRDLLLQLDGLPAGELQTRQFGGPLAGQVVPHPPTDTTGQLLLPAYSALFLAMDEAPVGDDDIGDDDDDDDDDDSSCSNPDDCDCRQGDGSSVDHSALVAALLASFVLRRRRS